MKRAIGMLLIATPFIAILGFGLLALGLVKTLAVVGITAAIFVCIATGVGLTQ